MAKRDDDRDDRDHVGIVIINPNTNTATLGILPVEEFREVVKEIREHREQHREAYDRARHRDRN